MFDVRVIKSAEHLCDIRSLCCVQADRCWEVSSEYYLSLETGEDVDCITYVLYSPRPSHSYAWRREGGGWCLDWPPYSGHNQTHY